MRAAETGRRDLEAASRLLVSDRSALGARRSDPRAALPARLVEPAKRRDPGFSIVVNPAAALGISLDAIASDGFSEVSIVDATQA